MKTFHRIFVSVVFLTGLTPATSASDRFAIYWIGPPGEALKAASGDVDGDGMADVVLLSTSQPSATSPQQAFVRSGVNGSLLHSWTPSVPDMWGFQGGFLGAAGDLNGDGFGDIALSIIDPSPPSIGAAVELRSGLDGSLMALIPPPFTVPSFLGFAIAGVGDMDGDAWPELLVAGPHLAAQCTAVYNFEAPVFNLQSYIPNWQCGQAFGNVGRLDDVDGDGLPDFYIGAPQAYGGFVFEGWIGVYSGATGSLIAPLFGGSTNVSLGGGIAALSDVTGDGMPELAALRSPPPWGPGEVALYSLPSFTVVYTIPASAVGTTALAIGGVAAAGDVDGDGFEDLLVRFPTQQGDVLAAFSGPTGAVLGQVSQGYPVGLFIPYAGLGDVNGDGLGDFATVPQMGNPSIIPPVGAQSLWSPWEWPNGSGRPTVYVARNLDLAAPAAVGGSAQFEVVAPKRAGRAFQILLSRDFLFPGTPLGPFLLPIAMDGLFWASFSAGIVGTLDATGHGSVSVPIPSLPSLQGWVVQASGVVYDPSGPLGIGCVLTAVPVPIE